MTARLVDMKAFEQKGMGRVEVFKWLSDFNLGDVAVSQEPRCVGIRGLPLHLWSLGFLRAIGGLCGGFVKVDEEIGRCELLEIAWIWIRGSSVDRIPRVITLFDRGREVKLEILLENLEKMNIAWLEGRLLSEEYGLEKKFEI